MIRGYDPAARDRLLDPPDTDEWWATIADQHGLDDCERCGLYVPLQHPDRDERRDQEALAVIKLLCACDRCDVPGCHALLDDDVCSNHRRCARCGGVYTDHWAAVWHDRCNCPEGPLAE